MNKDIRRRFRRYLCNIEVGVMSNNGKVFTSGTFDISEEGIFLFMPVPCVAGLMQDGAELVVGEFLVIFLPNYDNSKDLELDGSIVHTKTVIDGSYLVGVQFIGLESEVKAHITELLKHVE